MIKKRTPRKPLKSLKSSPPVKRPPPLRREPNPHKKGRWVIGLHSCAEVLKVRPSAVSELWLRDDWERSQELTALAEQAKRKGLKVTARAVGQLDAVGHGHQGVVMLVSENPQVNWQALGEPGPQIVLILDGLEDPQNLGSILRTAWLTQIKAVFIPEDRAVGLTTAVNKIASGGAEYVPVERFTNFQQPLEKLKKLGFWVYGLAEKGTRKPWEFELPQKVAWVIGSESSGMRVTTERLCDELVRLPQAATGSSYNASIALAMALSETLRQLGSPL